ncbi:MAG: hypothetical protein KDD35_10335, partial [Bdellovibrionales bacterium]|nr:hypothetical protein [Bdellovibrionales bacterium]
MAVNVLDLLRNNRADLSNFLIHLTKNGSFEVWKEMSSPIYAGRYLYDSSDTLDAEDSLKRILASNPPVLLARTPFGVFKLIGINVYKNQKLDIPPECLKSVCFSETPLRELPSFYKATQDPKNWSLKTNKYQKYGLAFDTEFVRNSGGHPVFYYDRRQLPLRNSIETLGHQSLQQTTKPILHLCEPYGPKVKEPTKEIDFRWEREWRIQGDFEFSLESVAFGMCPQDKIQDFEKLVNNVFPFVNPDWDIDDLKD